MTSFDVLSHEAKLALTVLERELPPHEWVAVKGWLSAFAPYQLEWLLDFGRFALLLKARQIGATHTYSAAATLWGLLGEKTMIVSIDDDAAQMVREYAEKHANVLAEFGSKWAVPSKVRKNFLGLESGGEIRSFSSTAAARGRSGNLLLDEVGKWQHPEDVWDAAGAAATHSGRIRLFSTPQGVGNFWHRFWVDPAWNEGYRKHEVTIDEAAPQLTQLGYPVDIEECWKIAHGDERVFNQLYRCAFLDSEDQYIQTKDILNCSIDPCYWHEGECYAGLDIGKKANRTELVIVREDPVRGVRWMVYNEARTRTDSEDIDRLVRTAFAAPYFAKKVCVDSTGLGTFPAEQLQKRYGLLRIEPVNFAPKVKEELATGLYSAFTKQTIRIPKNDHLLFEELCSLRREVTDAGNVRYVTPETVTGHGDKAWALALALYGCNRKPCQRFEHGPTVSIDRY